MKHAVNVGVIEDGRTVLLGSVGNEENGSYLDFVWLLVPDGCRRAEGSYWTSRWGVMTNQGQFAVRAEVRHDQIGTGVGKVVMPTPLRLSFSDILAVQFVSVGHPGPLVGVGIIPELILRGRR